MGSFLIQSKMMHQRTHRSSTSWRQVLTISLGPWAIVLAIISLTSVYRESHRRMPAEGLLSGTANFINKWYCTKCANTGEQPCGKKHCTKGGFLGFHGAHNCTRACTGCVLLARKNNTYLGHCEDITCDGKRRCVCGKSGNDTTVWQCRCTNKYWCRREREALPNPHTTKKACDLSGNCKWIGKY